MIWLRIIEVRVRSASEIIKSAAMVAIQFGIRTIPIRKRAIKLMASDVSENKTMAVAREMSKKRAWTSRKSTTAKAMMIKAMV